MDETLSVVSKFTTMFKTLVNKASTTVNGDTKAIDIVNDVINRIPIYWAANFVVRPKARSLTGVVYIRVSLVCLSPTSMHWQDTRYLTGMSCLLM